MRLALLLLLIASAGCALYCRRASSWGPDTTDAWGPTGCWYDDRDGGDHQAHWWPR
jgi:hypothetical protein